MYFQRSLLVIKASKVFFAKSRICDTPQMIDNTISDYDGNTVLVGGDDNAF